MTDLMRGAATAGRSISLRVMRVNPAQRRYARLGFRQVGETPTHVVMEWSPDPLSDAPLANE